MKDKLCFKKYRNYTLLYSVLLIISTVLCLLISIVDAMGYVGLVMCLLGFGSCIIYYIYSYYSYGKKALGIEAQIGTIKNWNVSGYRARCASVVLCVDGKEYSSPNYFGIYEAQEMVGKQVSYIIIEDTLLIYAILD